MKNLLGIVFTSWALFFVCSGEEKNKGGGSTQNDLVSVIMPDSALLQVDTVHLYVLRDSNLALFKLSKKQGQYKNAMEYNAQYRLYNDSVLKVARNSEIAEVRVRYDHETLIGEQQQLVLEKAQMQTSWLILLSVCLLVSGALLLFYQRRTIRKVRAIREAKKRIRELAEQIALNELTIRSNENLIQTISGQLEQQAGLEEQLHEQQADIFQISEVNEQLLCENEQLEGEVKEYASLLQDYKTEQPDLDRLLEENRTLQKQEKHFLELLIQQLKLISLLKEAPRPITPEEKEQLMDEMEVIYPGFVTHLHNTFTNLSDLDLQTCCLIKLQFKISQIAVITGVDAMSVSKRKLRIKEDMKTVKPDIWERGESLDIYLYKSGIVN